MGLKTDFEAFVRAQKPTAAIDHDSWKTCAIGKFAKSIKREVQEVVDILWHVYGVGKQSTDRAPMVKLYPEIKVVAGKSVVDRLNEMKGRGTYADVVALLG